MKTVYYSYANDHANKHGMIYGHEPVLAKTLFTEGRDVNELEFMKCPAFIDHLNNVYSVSTLHNIDLDVHDGHLTSSVMPQEFFESVTAHSDKEKIYGFDQRVVFIAEDDSLEISQESPFLSETRWGRDTNVIPGKLDIGKYFRVLQVAFSIKKGVKKLKIEEGEPFYYLRFHTDEQIKFVPFYWSIEFEDKMKNMRFAGKGYHKWKPLKFYYDVVKKKNIKKLIMKEINKNLMV